MKNFTKSISIPCLIFFLILRSNASHLKDQILLSARMSGSQEVPAVVTSAAGVAALTLNSKFDTLVIRMTVTGLSGPVTGVHIHRGAVGFNGPVILNLMPFLNGTNLTAIVTGSDLTPSLLSEYLQGKLYINAHTANNPGGEIRGQIRPETDIQFVANLRGDQENPPLPVAGSGLGIFTLSQDSSKLAIHVVANNLTGTITGAHFHRAAVGANGPVALDLLTFVNGTTLTANVDASSILADLVAGNIYINFHTAANPSGEIRGQLFRDPFISFDAVLNGDQEVPAVSTNAMGVSSIKLNATMDTLVYDVVFNGLSGTPTGAHIHLGKRGENGLVLYDLMPNLLGNRISGSVTGFTLEDVFLSNLLQGNFYINIHTAANPSGEIRGQVYRVLREGYSTTIEASQEVPATTSTAKGTALVSVDRDQTNLHFMVAADGLTATGIHFHKGVEGENGPVIFNITPFFVNNEASGYWKNTDASPFSLAHSSLFRNDSVYINLHTTANPGGEIRGQMDRGFHLPVVTGVNHRQQNSFSLYPNPASHVLYFKSEAGPVKRFMIYNNVGALVWTKQGSNPSEDSALDVSGLKSGVYQLMIQSATGNYMQRFSKE